MYRAATRARGGGGGFVGIDGVEVSLPVRSELGFDSETADFVLTPAVLFAHFYAPRHFPRAAFITISTTIYPTVGEPVAPGHHQGTQQAPAAPQET